jgi:hypothetical protein
VLWGRVNSHVIRGVHQEAIYYEGIIEDVTARKETEEALRLLDSAAHRLEQLSPDAAVPRPVLSAAEVEPFRPDPVTLPVDSSSTRPRGQPVDLLRHVRPKGFRQQLPNI